MRQPAYSHTTAYCNAVCVNFFLFCCYKTLEAVVSEQHVCLIKLRAWLDKMNLYADSWGRAVQTQAADQQSFCCQSYHSSAGCAALVLVSSSSKKEAKLFNQQY